MSFWPRLGRTILAHPWPIVVTVVIVTAVLGYWAVQVETDHTAGNFLSEDSRVIQQFRRASAVFGESQASLYVVFGDANYADPDFLSRLDSLTRRISTYEGVESVLSLANVPTLVRNGDSLVVERLFDPEADAETVRDRLDAQPFLQGLLISPDGKSTLMLVTIERKFNNSSARVDLVNQIEQDVTAMPATTALAGFPFLRTTYAQRVSAEAPLFTLLALLTSLILLMITFRSWRAVILPAIVMTAVLTWTIGLISIFGYKLNIVIAVLPALLVIIGMANAIHLLTRFFDTYAQLGSRHDALIETIRTVGLASFLACLTTAIGFFVLNFSGSALLAVFGTFATLGIAFIYVLSITLIPLAYDRMRPPSERAATLATHDVFSTGFDRLAVVVEKRAPLVLIIAGALVILGIIGGSRISSDIYVFSDFSPDDPLRTDLAIFESAFGGVLPMEVIIESDREGAFRNPSHIRRVASLQDSLKELDEVGMALSAADLLKLTTQAYFGGHPANFRLPATYEMPFLESALGRLFRGGDSGITSNLPQMVDSTFTMTRIYLGVDDIGTEAMNALSDSVATMARAVLPPEGFDVFVTGTAITATRSGENLVRNLVWSLILALLIISLVMGMLFRNVRLTIISVVPNVIPLVFVAGAMGYLQIPFKPSTALIYPLAFGIAVDSSIHFLAKYRILISQGTEQRDLIRITLRETGKAILFTSLVLAGGFLIFTLSSFGGTAGMGALTALTLIIAMISNLFVLPAMLVLFTPRGDRESSADLEASQVSAT